MQSILVKSKPKKHANYVFISRVDGSMSRVVYISFNLIEVIHLEKKLL